MVTPFLSDKDLSIERITLIENDKIINNDNMTANIMNTFFSDIVTISMFLNIMNMKAFSKKFLIQF